MFSTLRAASTSCQCQGFCTCSSNPFEHIITCKDSAVTLNPGILSSIFYRSYLSCMSYLFIQSFWGSHHLHRQCNPVILSSIFTCLNWLACLGCLGCITCLTCLAWLACSSNPFEHLFTCTDSAVTVNPGILSSMLFHMSYLSCLSHMSYLSCLFILPVHPIHLSISSPAQTVQWQSIQVMNVPNMLINMSYLS